jgi:hypothetical protein
MDAHCPHCGIQLPERAGQFCPKCQEPLDGTGEQSEAIAPASTIARLHPALTDGKEESEALMERIVELELRTFELERRLQKSLLFSDSFYTRAFTIFGHFLVVYMIIALPFIFIAVCMDAMRGMRP